LYKAQLVGVYMVTETPEELRPFLNIQAKQERRELKLNDRFAALQVEGTSSYVVAFLDSLRSVEDLEKRLKQQECELDPVSRRSLERVLKGRGK